jgi:hypothetical protein
MSCEGCSKGDLCVVDSSKVVHWHLRRWSLISSFMFDQFDSSVYMSYNLQITDDACDLELKYVGANKINCAISCYKVCVSNSSCHRMVTERTQYFKTRKFFPHVNRNLIFSMIAVESP